MRVVRAIDHLHSPGAFVDHADLTFVGSAMYGAALDLPIAV